MIYGHFTCFLEKTKKPAGLVFGFKIPVKNQKTCRFRTLCVRNESIKSNRQDAEVAMERNSTTRQNATSMRNSSIINDSNQRPRSDLSECTYPNDSPIDPSLDSSTNQSAESSTSKTDSDQSQNETDLLMESNRLANIISNR